LIDAEVDSETPYGNSLCSELVGVPGTMMLIELQFDYDLLQLDIPDCNENGCSQNITGSAYKIKFVSSDACMIESDNFPYTAAIVTDHHPNDPNDPFDSFRIESTISNFQCLPPYSNPSCPLYPWAPGDPSNSHSNPYMNIDIYLTDSSASKFDGFVLPTDLGTLASDPQFDDGFITITIFDIYSQMYIHVNAQVIKISHMTPSSLIVDLIDAITEINSVSGILNSLDAKLDSALEALDNVNEQNDAAAINKLQAFINAVEAQRGNHISEEDADILIAASQEIIDMLNLQ
jgi:hypothetical protein